MRKSAPINVIVHYPTTEEGKRELVRRVTSMQADFVTDTICKLNCPTSKKLALLNAVIDAAKKEKGERIQRAKVETLSLE